MVIQHLEEDLQVAAICNITNTHKLTPQQHLSRPLGPFFKKINNKCQSKKSADIWLSQVSS